MFQPVTLGSFCKENNISAEFHLDNPSAKKIRNFLIAAVVSAALAAVVIVAAHYAHVPMLIGVGAGLGFISAGCLIAATALGIQHKLKQRTFARELLNGSISRQVADPTLKEKGPSLKHGIIFMSREAVSRYRDARAVLYSNASGQRTLEIFSTKPKAKALYDKVVKEYAGSNTG